MRTFTPRALMHMNIRTAARALNHSCADQAREAGWQSRADPPIWRDGQLDAEAPIR